MVAFDANEILTPFCEGHREGAILFDCQRMRQVEYGLFVPAWWGGRAHAVSEGGRGSAWFVEASFGNAVLRQYRRGGMIAMLNRDRYFWCGGHRTRSVLEFRLMRELISRGLPVPTPLAACYVRYGVQYRAAILMERLEGVSSLAMCVRGNSKETHWEQIGRMISRFHREGLDHADLNAHNILLDQAGQCWLIDFDRGALRIPATKWRERNLARLLRSLLKIRGERSVDAVYRDFERLRRAYDLAWSRGC
ncbi:3-deoxy-D-manno-octulosonic acid kinase [Xylella fastidiosa]|uniref:3-deoxy-D-manno-octulosonic acid kinase n=1 Tax=Xylella fastidiosa TaxID=2371 RepID=A0ABC8AET9_XYLFS|nr:3-deoxy-D-manno-octulosonic acid kinase [Xylella fastidiosa]ALR06832.1 3-deoxy-D-manno-octulosonic acid kinase [Xylella fastidiosa]